MSKHKVPHSKGTMADQPRTSGSETESEKEPLSPESSAKKDQKFTTVETSEVKGKKSVPKDSTAQRGKTPPSSSEGENEKNNFKKKK